MPSTERRLRRFLANPAVTVRPLWRPLLPHLLRRWAGQEVVLVFDPTPYRGDWTVLWVGIVVPRRLLPLSWCLVPQQRSWPATLPALLARPARPDRRRAAAGLYVTLAGRPRHRRADPDRCGAPAGLGRGAAPERGRDAKPIGCAWSGGLGRGGARLWDWVEQVGTGWNGPVQIFKGAGWRDGWLTVHRRAGCAEWWILFSTRPGGRERSREYARRARVEATFADGKGRGWGVERSRMTDPVHLDRLLLVWHLALWWLHALGRRSSRPASVRTSIAPIAATAASSASAGCGSRTTCSWPLSTLALSSRLPTAGSPAAPPDGKLSGRQGTPPGWREIHWSQCAVILRMPYQSHGPGQSGVRDAGARRTAWREGYPRSPHRPQHYGQ